MRVRTTPRPARWRAMKMAASRHMPQPQPNRRSQSKEKPRPKTGARARIPATPPSTACSCRRRGLLPLRRASGVSPPARQALASNPPCGLYEDCLETTPFLSHRRLLQTVCTRWSNVIQTIESLPRRQGPCAKRPVDSARSWAEWVV